jgi:hypothetical protein
MSSALEKDRKGSKAVQVSFRKLLEKWLAVEGREEEEQVKSVSSEKIKALIYKC